MEIDHFKGTRAIEMTTRIEWSWKYSSKEMADVFFKKKKKTDLIKENPMKINEKQTNIGRKMNDTCVEFIPCRNGKIER